MNKIKKIEKITRFATPEESPGYLLWKISSSWRNFIEKILKPFDLTHPQFVVLATTAWLTRNENHTNQIDISKASGLDPNTTSQVLRSLESKKFIKRVQSLNERSKNPKLTPKGLQVLSEALPAVEETDTKFFDCLNLDETNNMIKTFQKMISASQFN